MPADAVEEALHSFHCVMAASASIGQSQYSCPWMDRPLQAEREKYLANRVCCWTAIKNIYLYTFKHCQGRLCCELLPFMNHMFISNLMTK